jgi:aspartate racemase
MKSELRIGILGGMGPMAGVLLQRLIIEHTPAKKDQDHIQVVCFTDPKIPDRTESLDRDGGASYLRSVIESLSLLENAGCDIALIPCNTAHSRMREITASTSLNVLDMVLLTFRDLNVLNLRKIGLLATDGTLRSSLYQNNVAFEWILPDYENQRLTMEVIYSIKAGDTAQAEEKITSLLSHLFQKGAQTVVFGCTELSLFSEKFAEQFNIIDPLGILARESVRIALQE